LPQRRTLFEQNKKIEKGKKKKEKNCLFGSPGVIVIYYCFFPVFAFSRARKKLANRSTSTLDSLARLSFSSPHVTGTTSPPKQNTRPKPRKTTKRESLAKKIPKRKKKEKKKKKKKLVDKTP
jgi:hypothetical protein